MAALIRVGAIGNLFDDAGGGGIGGAGAGGRGAAGNGAAATAGTRSRAAEESRRLVLQQVPPCATLCRGASPARPPPIPPPRAAGAKGSHAGKCRHSAAGRALKLQEAAAKAAKPKAANTAECQPCATK